MKKSAATAVLSVLLLVTSACLAGDWPNFRGPNWDGKSTETGLLKSWPERGPPLAWKVEGLGKGFSSVAITGGKIFTMGDREDQQWVIVLDLATRKELWAAKVGEPWKTGKGGPRCTP
ncbi:MAG: PQQ-binding-like beta-propeller repeat protein, partial [Planctomycetota bacterium]